MFVMVVNSNDQKQGSTNRRCLRKVLFLKLEILTGQIRMTRWSIGVMHAHHNQQASFHWCPRAAKPYPHWYPARIATLRAHPIMCFALLQIK